MSKAKENKYLALAEAFSAGATIEQACEVAQIGISTWWRWVAECAKDPNAHTFEYPGYGTMSVVDARHLGEKKFLASTHDEYLREGRYGRKRKKYFQGEQVWAKDPVLCADALDPELWAMLHPGRPITDVYLRDPETGGLVQLEEWEPASDAKQLSILKALGGPAWRDQKDVNVNVSGGVRVIGQPKPTKLIEHSPADQELIEQAARQFIGLPDEEILEPDVSEDDRAIVHVIPEPPRDLPGDVDPIELVTPGEKEVALPAPAHPAPPDAPKMSALRADLLRKMTAGVKNPNPTAQVTVFSAKDE